MKKAVWGLLSPEITELGLGAGAARQEQSGGANRSRSVNYWRLLHSVRGGRQSVKLIVLIILIEYDYQVVSNGGTNLRGTASWMRLPCCCAEVFLALTRIGHMQSNEVTWRLISWKRF
jgi:hypothetical protein